jgi:hypothetical protein
VVFLPLTIVRLVRGLLKGMLAGCGPGSLGCGDRVWAGQATVAGGPVVA